MAIKAVVFDLDGTLLNTIDDLTFSVNELLQQYSLPIHTADNYKKFVGNGIDTLIKRAFPSSFIKSTNVDKLTSELKEIYLSHLTDRTKPYEGIETVLDTLTKQNILINVFSNKPDRETNLLIKHYFSNYNFKFVIGASERFPKKPAPDALFFISNELKIACEDFVYIGDSDVDMITANNANMIAVGALWGFRDKKELINNGAKFLISKPLELLDIIKR